MKTKYISFVAMAAAALATSCTSDDIAEQEQSKGGSQKMTLTASVNDDTNTTTRVGMTKKDNNTASFYWHKDDAILVQTKGSDTYSGEKFTTSTETGETTATFTGTITSGTLGTYAVYPYSDKHGFTSETTLSYNLPGTYTYNKVESSIFSKTASSTYPENSTNIPMVGEITDGNIEFKHIGGLAVIRIDKMPVDEGTLTVTADHQLSGNFSVDLSADEPKMTTTTASENNTVTFTFSNASTTSAGVFYLPLATGEYTSVKVTIGETAVDCGSVSISRAGVTAVSIATYEGKLVRSYGSNKYYLGDGKYSISDHVFVDLGLASGMLWAETNVGATNSYDYGNYYSPSAAAGAASSWSSSCSVPSTDNFSELINSCTSEWTTENGVNGRKVTGTNGNSIFLPAAGYNSYFMDMDLSTGMVYYRYIACNQGTQGHYCSSSSSYCLYFDNGNFAVKDFDSENQARVRPVATLN